MRHKGKPLQLKIYQPTQKDYLGYGDEIRVVI